jgi:hypothetical protein
MEMAMMYGAIKKKGLPPPQTLSNSSMPYHCLSIGHTPPKSAQIPEVF